MSITIKKLPKAERPYEKLELYGEKTLSNAELLAIIIKTGTREETSVQVAQRILQLNPNEEDDRLHFLRNVTLAELQKIKGIGKVKAIQLKAVSELSVRMQKPSHYKGMEVKNPEQIAEMLLEEFRFETRELARLYLISRSNQIIKIVDVAFGGSYFVNMKLKDVIIEAIKVNASKMLLVHNHPSGNSAPSEKDIHTTDELFNLASQFEIDLIDHIIIGNMEYTSIYTYIQKKIREIEKGIKRE